ncbi:DNA (cytosine-5)-methyltransferase 1 [Sphingomonas vulcanisoli]|uniref:Cytosine-specific methyltransferase n=1 Tax=Sphingomonas vulcanisoli TaxID=1658060 RepID=A0ABX0TTL2_9SPHN|nr:DNA (cytosine-5-)-methyltransferase [Sphingomonas vulcanisoli]NIJ08796.1 DNA (cytosine-5)-methyltransferase 1 [Sphingomonas vulcanisoli]
MRPKSGLPKRKSLRRMPDFTYGMRNNPALFNQLNPMLTLQGFPADTYSVVSFFAGCGGLDLGALGGFTYHNRYYEPQPFNILAAYDNDPKAVAAYKLNISDHAHVADLTKVDMRKVPAADILFGGFPCQDFSSCGHKQGFAGPRGMLYQKMVDYMKIHQPKIVVGENVPLLKGMKEGALLDQIVRDLTNVGYRVKYWFLNCPDYGLPASRRRIFIICVRNDIPGFPAAPQASHVMRHVSIDEAIDDLIDITDESVPNQSQYFVATKATAGAGQGDQTSERGKVGYAVRANAKARIHFHYELERRLTVRELARLQSFPDEFVFPFAAGPNVILIGNAVPPIVGHAVTKSIVNFLESVREQALPKLRFAS